MRLAEQVGFKAADQLACKDVQIHVWRRDGYGRTEGEPAVDAAAEPETDEAKDKAVDIAQEIGRTAAGRQLGVPAFRIKSWHNDGYGTGEDA